MKFPQITKPKLEDTDVEQEASEDKPIEILE